MQRARTLMINFNIFNTLQKIMAFSILLGISFIIASCAGSKPSMREMMEKEQLSAAGVDSSIVAEADSLADDLFVSWERQQLASKKQNQGEAETAESNELWTAFSKAADGGSASPEDTLAAIEEFNKGAEHLLALQELQASDTAIDADDFRKQSLTHLDSARVYFEQSFLLNPFDTNTRIWLARVYQLLAERFLEDAYMDKAAVMMENLLRVDKGQHGLYGRLGQVYMALERWQKARQNFQSAEDVLQQTAMFMVPEGEMISDSTVEAATDSAAWFLYVYYQAEMDIRLYEAESALASLERASFLSRNPEDSLTIKSTRDWINWDDGNIPASEYRDELQDLVDNDEYEDAAAGYKSLSKRLKTDRARREAEWRLAILEYSHLGKEEQALERLAVVAKYYLDDESGTALADTMYRQYYISYGTMCHNHGLMYLNDKKFRKALAYFKQSCVIPWKQRAKSYLEIAKLSINNPTQAVESAENALAGREELSRDEIKESLRIMVTALKRLGRFEEAAAYFREYRQQASIAKTEGTE